MDKKLQIWCELQELQARYVSALDGGRIEDWPTFFTPECRYEIIPKENADADFPAPVIYCNNQKMLRDRVVSLLHANIYERHTYRHMTSGLVVTDMSNGSATTTSNYVVVITGLSGETHIYQAGRYEDDAVCVDGTWLYRRKRVVYDTLRVQTLLATPI